MNKEFWIAIAIAGIIIASTTPIFYSSDNTRGPKGNILEVADTKMTELNGYEEHRKNFGALEFLLR